MGVSILSEQDRFPLGNGMVLRLLSAGELIRARRQARAMAENAMERPLCSNACLIAMALEAEGEETPFFRDAEQVLAALTAEEIEALACRWDTFRRGVSPGQEQGVERGFNPNFDESRFGRREESAR